MYASRRRHTCRQCFAPEIGRTHFRFREKWRHFRQIHGEHEGSGYRSLLARNTGQKLRFYALNPEHAGLDGEESLTEYQTEFDNADNVNVYGLKSETRTAGSNAIWAPLGIKGSNNVKIFGYGGLAVGSNNQATGNISNALIHIVDSDNYLLANIVHAANCDSPMICNWKVMRDTKGTSVLTTPSTQSVTLLRRGNPTISP